MAIRPAVPADLDALARVHVDAWHETYDGLLPAAVIGAHSVESRRAIWSAWLRDDPPGGLHVAEADGAVVGFAAMAGAATVAAFADAELYAIYLRKAWQGRGLGHGLMAAAIASARALPAAALGFWVLPDNARALRFYAAAGAVSVADESFEMAGTPVRHIGMRIDLAR